MAIRDLKKRFISYFAKRICHHHINAPSPQTASHTRIIKNHVFALVTITTILYSLPALNATAIPIDLSPTHCIRTNTVPLVWDASLSSNVVSYAVYDGPWQSIYNERSVVSGQLSVVSGQPVSYTLETTNTLPIRINVTAVDALGDESDFAGPDLYYDGTIRIGVTNYVVVNNPSGEPVEESSVVSGQWSVTNFTTLILTNPPGSMFFSGYGLTITRSNTPGTLLPLTNAP